MSRAIKESQKKTLAKIFASVTFQGPEHEQNIKTIFTLISKACAEEFSEDNLPTLKGYLMELLEESIDTAWKEQDVKYKREMLNRMSDEDLLKLNI